MNPKIINTFNAVLLCQLFAFAIIAVSTFSDSKPVLADEVKQPEVNVSATGKVSAEPDMALVSFGVVREARTAREALNDNNQAMASVLTALESSGIANKDIQTSNFNISPRYHYPKRSSDGSQPPPKITGYAVSNNVTIRVRELAKLGTILDEVVSLGVNSGGNIQFQNQNPAEILEEARTKAVKNAMAKAQTLATAAGVKLGPIIEIRENTLEPRPVPMARTTMMEASSDAAAVPIAGGENSYSVHVQMRWALEQ